MLSIFSDVMPKKENEELEKELENKFYSQAKVSQDIEEIYTKNSDMSYIDSVMHFCELNKIDVESIPKLISKPLKEKIKYEAMELNFLKRSSRAKLSIWKSTFKSIFGRKKIPKIFSREGFFKILCWRWLHLIVIKLILV